MAGDAARSDEGSFRMAASNPAPEAVAELVPYEVRRGDSLWTIARRYDTTVDRLRAENGLRTSRIYAGQVLDVPVSR
ncbi:MAG: LysM peptidoglycan-binding domain-containing protein [Gemmatimonadetes bacterium]|nr:LysM peptidoglycan-binding domain-containing protein [Gemmatimonadota bacterium]